MGTIIIKNLSSVRDECAVHLAFQILAKMDENQIYETADRYHVDVGVKTDAKGIKTFTVTDRD